MNIYLSSDKMLPQELPQSIWKLLLKKYCCNVVSFKWNLNVGVKLDIKSFSCNIKNVLLSLKIYHVVYSQPLDTELSQQTLCTWLAWLLKPPKKKPMRKIIFSRAFCKSRTYFLCPLERMMFPMISIKKGFNLNELSICQGKAEIQENFAF